MTQPNASWTCPSCGFDRQANEKCARCGRPLVLDPAYVNQLEALAGNVVSAAYATWDDLHFVESDDPLRSSLKELAEGLGHYHYEGDGCVDDV